MPRARSPQFFAEGESETEERERERERGGWGEGRGGRRRGKIYLPKNGTATRVTCAYRRETNVGDGRGRDVSADDGGRKIPNSCCCSTKVGFSFATMRVPFSAPELKLESPHFKGNHFDAAAWWHARRNPFEHRVMAATINQMGQSVRGSEQRRKREVYLGKNFEWGNIFELQ